MYEILNNVIGVEVSPEIVKDNGKRKRSSDQEDKEFLNSDKIKKIKVNPQKSEKKITNHKKIYRLRKKIPPLPKSKIS